MKTCSKCHIEKDENEFNTCSRNPDGKYSQCKLCHKEGEKLSRNKNKKQISNYQREYYRRNKQRILARIKISNKANYVKYWEKHKVKRDRYRKENKERFRIWNRDNKIKACKNLSDYYIKKVLRGFGISTVISEKYPQLIELKRLEIKTFRLLKNQTQ